MDRAASEVGVTKATYLAWELGRHRPRGETLDLLCRAFHVPARDLGYDQYETSDNESEQAILLRLTPEQVAEVLSLLGLGETLMTDFDPDRRDAILRILKTAGLTTLPVLAKVVTSEPWERLSSAITKPSGMNATTVKHFESLVVDCWGLSNNGN